MAVSYDDDVHPYSDLALGRVDAVLLDNVLADRAMRRMGGFFTHPDAVAVGHYIIITAPENTALRDRVDAILREAMRDGTLEAIFRKWQSWNDDQPRLYTACWRPPPTRTTATSNRQPRARQPAAAWRQRSRDTCPSLLRAAVITLILSCVSMALAVTLGVGIATGRVYGGTIVRGALTVYVEVMRGTPVLLQLFVIYYGLARSDPAACIRGSARRPGAQLRRLRERNLPERAGGRAARAARGGAHPRAHAVADAAAGPRARRPSASRSPR